MNKTEIHITLIIQYRKTLHDHLMEIKYRKTWMKV